MNYIDIELLSSKIKEIEDEFKTGNYYLDNSEQVVGYVNALSDFTNIIKSLQQKSPEVFDTVAFQKGVQEGRRLESEDALTISDVELLHTFLYAVKNNKQGVFTFTRLTDEQYEEVLRRFNNAKEK